jgi:exodeoxyribonuclease VII small subunit
MASAKKKTDRKTTPGGDGEPSFEDALARLEDLVERLEEGEVPLEESLAAYAEGTRLVKLCMDRLARAESTVRELHASTQGFRLEAPDAAPDGDAEDGGDDDGEEGPNQDDLGF